MRFREAGKITDHLWYLGREESGTYYLEGRDGAILINGGLSYILPDVLAQMKEGDKVILNPPSSFMDIHFGEGRPF